MKKIYLATPYSDPDPAIQQSRFEVVNRVAGDLMREGFLVFSPITHCHSIALVSDLPKDWKFWKEIDLAFILWVDEVYVLRQDGWKESIGVTAEIKIAKELNKPIIYIDP